MSVPHQGQRLLLKKKMKKLIMLDPSSITSFTDAVRSGCFTLSIVRNNKMKVGLQFQLSFQSYASVYMKKIKLY